MRPITGNILGNSEAARPHTGGTQQPRWRRHIAPLRLGQQVVGKHLHCISSSVLRTQGKSDQVGHPPFLCPSCGQQLQEDGGFLKCAAGHTISIAREGHVYLRASGRKKKESGAVAGDDLAMVRARRAFFDAGHYTSVARAVAQAVMAAMASDPTPRDRSVLDAGCGEGRYLGFVGEEAASAGVDAALTGIDVSKHAVAMAAKRYGDAARFAVASSYALPFDAHSFDVVMCVFSPLAVSEFVRVAKPGGALVVATSGPDHLMALKELLYEEARVYIPRLEAVEAVGRVEQVVHVRERLRVEGTDAKSLLAMTPFWWTAKQEHQSAVANVPLDTFVDVEVRVIRLP